METDPILQRFETETVARDRRRAGRGTEVSAELIPLLRGTAGSRADLIEPIEKSDPLSVARGLKLGVWLSALVWAAIGLAVWIYLEP